MFPILPANSATSFAPYNDEGIFGFGEHPKYSLTNLVSNLGVISTDTTGVGTARDQIGACEYGDDKGIFGFGYIGWSIFVNETNKVSNAGVVASDTTGVGTEAGYKEGCSYGGDKGIFGFGNNAGPSGGSDVAFTNLVTNLGVVGTDVTGVGTARTRCSACEYGGDKGIFGFGEELDTAVGDVSYTNLVSNSGVVSTDVTGVGTARDGQAACGYGSGQGIFGFGNDGSSDVSYTNLVSTAGVVSTDVTGLGTARNFIAATQYGEDKGIFAYGHSSGNVSTSNLVSDVGVISADVSGVGTVRSALGACSFG